MAPTRRGLFAAILDRIARLARSPPLVEIRDTEAEQRVENEVSGGVGLHRTSVGW